MKKILTYLKNYIKESILGPLFKLLEASFELLVPLVIAAIVDEGIAAADKTMVLRNGALLVILGLVGLVCSVTAQYFAAKAAVGAAGALRRDLFAHIQKLSFSQQDKAGISTLITRMTSDVNQVQSGINLTLRLFLRSPFVVFGAMIMAFTINTRAALIFLVTIALLSCVVFGIMLWGIPRYAAVQRQLDRVLGLTRENLTGVRVIRAFHREELEKQTFAEENGTLTRLQLFVGRVSSLMNPATYLILNLALILLLRSGALQVQQGILTQGQVVALVNYLSQILVELVKLANLILTMTKAVACAGRISAVLELPVEESGSLCPQAAAEDILVFSGVSLTYPSAAAPSLSGIDFRLKKGQTLGIIGGTGSGKSSLVQLIAGFYPATEGQVLVDGVDVTQYEPTALRRRIGYVPQKAALFRGSIRDNLLFADPNATEETLLWALETAQAMDFVAEKGLDSPVEQEGRNLSGGQRQRLTIARALVRKPDILILDDSASALDLNTDRQLRQALRQLTDMTLVIVSQRSASLMQADQILVLDDGEMVGLGRHDELLNTCSVYREIFLSQFPEEEVAV